MRRTAVGAVVALAVVGGLALRVARLEVRPMHHDEANQAVKFGALLERGEYRYDAHDHHGPTLYYLSLPAARLRGQATLAELDERTLRGVTAVFGAAIILLLPWLVTGIGRSAVAASAVLIALSPAMVFYSRMYIQESLFVFFILAFVIAIGRAATGTGLAWAAAAGVSAGLAVATKETSLIVLPAALAACVAAWLSLGPSRGALGRDRPRLSTLVFVALPVAAAVAAVFFSSFLSFPAGVLEPFRGLGIYLERGVAPANHGQPWHYYLSLLAYSSSGGLAWSEGLVLGLAVIGAVTALARPNRSRPEHAFWIRYLVLYALLTTVAFSVIRYKTPWNLLPFYASAIVLAGIGFSTLVGATASRLVAVLVTVVVGAGAANLGWQAWRASVVYSADPRNPYVYAQTVPDAVRMAARIRALATLHPLGHRMQVSVFAPPHEQWPLPWYVRAMPNVGYWTGLDEPDATHAPVLVASLDHTEALDESLGDRYVSEFYGLRPEVPLALYVERELWERFLATVTSLDPGPCALAPDAAGLEGCGPAPSLAMWQPEEAR